MRSARALVLLVVLSAVGLLGADTLQPRPAEADTSGCVDEGSGDAADPRGDAVRVCFSYDGQTLGLALLTAQVTDPATDVAWEGTTEMRWELDLGGDGVVEFTAVYGRYGGTLQVGVLDVNGNLRCTGSPGLDGAGYTAQVPASCLADPAPASVAIAGTAVFDVDPTDPDAVEVVDRIPDAGFAPPVGPAPAPSPTPAPPPADECAPTVPIASDASGVDRVAGESRIQTAIALSRDTWPSCADTVVLARADAYPDALAGAPLAVRAGGPLLLTGRDGLDPAAAEELRRLGPKVVLLLGGEQALSSAVAEDVGALGVPTVDRLAGADRFATAARIASELGGGEAIVTQGVDPDPRRGWPDAVSASAYAATRGIPILLTATDALPEATSGALSALGTTSVIVVGGEAAVSDGVEEQLAAEGRTVERIAGQDRYGTSVAVAAEAVERGSDPGRTYFATGLDYPDALAAGAAAGALGAPLVLLDGSDVAASPESGRWIDTYGDAWTRATLVGGTNAISETTAAAVRAGGD